MKNTYIKPETEELFVHLGSSLLALSYGGLGEAGASMSIDEEEDYYSF